ncbi:hypothetical protein RFF25_03965 [Pasteurella multocida]|uniref:DUF7424 family protein n=1 Tax=Pasteurella multocida TaxID=747 RepID=UPI002B47DC6A|nr:hypothetical protein [Pasteurella multocida]WRK01723.1 hypothetical protein RFF25_03965 [Pasteurella multocida]
MDREYLSDLALSLTHKINNDTNQALDVTFLSAYMNASPVDFLPLIFKQGESIEVKLSNASSDMLWQYEASSSVSMMTKALRLMTF